MENKNTFLLGQTLITLNRFDSKKMLTPSWSTLPNYPPPNYFLKFQQVYPKESWDSPTTGDAKRSLAYKSRSPKNVNSILLST